MDYMDEVDAQDYMDDIADKVHDHIDGLATTYDTKLLAVVMLIRAAEMLQGLRAAGVWNEKDIVDIMVSTTSRALTELEQAPTVVTLGSPASIN